MFDLRNASIRKKLTGMSLLASGTALLLACGAFLAYDWISFRNSMVGVFSVRASVIGYNSVSALLFRDEGTASQTLAALKADAHVTSAAVYNKEGRLFATYSRGDAAGGFQGPPRLSAPSDTARFEKQHLIVFRRIIFQGEPIGTIYIQSDLDELSDRLKGYVGISLVVLSLSTLVALLISAKLQRAFSQPVARLAEAATIVSREKNYSIRVPASDNRDELGLLVETFNEMLSQIEQRDAALQQATAELQATNAELEAADIERKRAEEEIKRLFHLSLDLQCIAGFDGYFKRLNPAWEKTLGFTVAELRAKPYLEFIHPEDREATLAEAKKQSAGQAVISFENRYRCKDGSYRWLAWTAYPIPEAQLIYAAARDISDRKRAEEALRVSEAKFRGLLEGAATPIVGVNSQGLIVLVNAATERLFGYTREELLHCRIETLVPERFREAHGGHRMRYATQPGTRPMGLCMELFARRKDGSEVPVEISLSPTETPEGLLVMAIIIDISARKQTEERLKKHAAELQAVNAELDAFTYSVAHDLRSPLRRVDGFAQLLLEEYNAGLPDEARHYLHRVREGTRQMGQLVDDLLNLARVGRREVNRQVTGLGSLVQEVVAELKREAGGRAIEWKIQSLPFVECDPALMKVVFTNLLSNAVKYTRPRPQAVVEVGTLNQNGETVVFVRDNGVGFSMKYADKLFGVFQRLHRPEDFEGTGVGLATVQRIVHKHGGQVWAEGELDKGACFYFALGTPQQIEPQVRSDSGKETYVAR